MIGINSKIHANLEYFTAESQGVSVEHAGCARVVG